MGLTDRLARAAARRPHVLVVPVPGRAPLRWAVEDALDELGWARAASPAGADVLVVCGAPGPELAPHVDVAWDAVPGPRVRTALDDGRDVHGVLTAAQAGLRDLAAQRLDAATRPAPALSAADARGHDDDSHGETHHGDTDGATDGHGEHDRGGEPDGGEHGDGDGDDHSMHMPMDLPGGLVMADRVEDRDGLRLEGLHLSLGPLLPAWPAGLRLDVVLSGDVLVAAEVHRLDAQPEPPAAPTVRALDAVATLLEAAGWQDGALRARRARADGGTGPATDDLLGRLRRARLLRWSLRGLPGPGGGDLVDHLDRLAAAVRGEQDLPTAAEQGLAAAVTGLDVGTAHLVVAAHGPVMAVPSHV